MDFDTAAATWDENDARSERTRAVAEAVRARLGSAHRARALDVGAGTGSLSLLLADLFDEIVLVDTSAGMLAVAAEKVAAGPGVPARITTLVADLSGPDGTPAAGLVPVDAAYSLMALHHVADVDALLRALHGLVVPRGVVLLADLVAEDGSYHAHHGDFDGHNGFERTDLEAALTGAGFEPVGYEIAATVRREGEHGEPREYPVFLLTARRA